MRLLLVLGALMFSTSVLAADMSAEGAWSLPSKGPNGAVFVELHNSSGKAIKLTAAKANISKTVEIHDHEHGKDGVMRMRPVENITIPAGGSVTLAPGGKHIMLMGIADPLATGKTFPVTLVFDNGQKLETKVEVRTAAE